MQNDQKHCILLYIEESAEKERLSVLWGKRVSGSLMVPAEPHFTIGCLGLIDAFAASGCFREGVCCKNICPPLDSAARAYALQGEEHLKFRPQWHLPVGLGETSLGNSAEPDEQ